MRSIAPNPFRANPAGRVSAVKRRESFQIPGERAVSAITREKTVLRRGLEHLRTPLAFKQRTFGPMRLSRYTSPTRRRSSRNAESNSSTRGLPPACFPLSTKRASCAWTSLIFHPSSSVWADRFSTLNNACRAFPEPQGNELRRGPKRNFQVLSPLEFWAEFTQHIPPTGSHLIR